MFQPLISVIVPVYNVEDYLEQCLDSILSQTYQNIEVLVINDGSTDRSGEICNTYAAKDSRIKVFHQANAGVSAARNFALSQVQGDYITIVDADDGIHEPFLEELYRELLAHDADIAVSNYYKYSEYDGKFYFHNLNKDDLVEVLTPQGCLDYQCDIKDYIGMAFIPVWGKLYKRHLFQQVDFPEGLIIDDEVVTHKLFMTAKTVVLVNKNHYLYRVRPGSAMTDGQKRMRRIRDSIRAFEIKLTDMTLAGFQTDLMSRRFAYLLWDFKNTIEANGFCESESKLYHAVCQRLDWFNHYREE